VCDQRERRRRSPECDRIEKNSRSRGSSQCGFKLSSTRDSSAETSSEVPETHKDRIGARRRSTRVAKRSRCMRQRRIGAVLPSREQYVALRKSRARRSEVSRLDSKSQFVAERISLRASRKHDAADGAADMCINPNARGDAVSRRRGDSGLALRIGERSCVGKKGSARLARNECVRGDDWMRGRVAVAQ